MTVNNEQIDEDIEEQKPLKSSLWSSLRRDTHWKCLILTAIVLGCFGAICWCRVAEVTVHSINYSNFPIWSTRRASPCENGYVYIPIAFVVTVYMVYLVECWHCGTRIELRYRVDVNAIYERVRQMRDAQPVVWWKAICYHYVRRSRQVTRYRNGDAYTSTQVFYERINSHSASATFVFAHCGVQDISKRLVNLDPSSATKIRFSKGFAFANLEAAAEFEEQRARFFQEHERRDDYMEMREGLELTNVNFKEFLVAFADRRPRPWYASQVVFWISSALLASWPLRVLVESRTAHVHYQVTKLFGVNYAAPSPITTPTRDLMLTGSHTSLALHGLVTPSSTFTSNDLEWDIHTNSGLVPSYSEALLMNVDDDASATHDSGFNEVVTSSPQTTASGAPIAILAPLATSAPLTEVATPPSARARSNSQQYSRLEDDSRQQRHRLHHRHSWALFCSRPTNQRAAGADHPPGGMRPSLTRLSLHNGRVLYHQSALWMTPTASGATNTLAAGATSPVANPTAAASSTDGANSNQNNNFPLRRFPRKSLASGGGSVRRSYGAFLGRRYNDILLGGFGAILDGVGATGSLPSPPDYEVAIQVSRPLPGNAVVPVNALRRSQTDRELGVHLYARDVVCNNNNFDSVVLVSGNTGENQLEVADGTDVQVLRLEDGETAL